MRRANNNYFKSMKSPNTVVLSWRPIDGLKTPLHKIITITTIQIDIGVKSQS